MNYPERKPIRLENYDYSSAGAYFITICTHDKKCFLSNVIVGALHEVPEVQLTEYGEIVKKYILELPKRYDIVLDRYIIMPNHVHLLLIIDDRRALREAPLRETGDRWALREATLRETDDRRALREAPLRETGDCQTSCEIIEQEKHQRSIISKAIGFMKMNSSRDIHIKRPDLPIWQRQFYDHIIRNETDYLKISDYIEYNAIKWIEDRYYTD